MGIKIINTIATNCNCNNENTQRVYDQMKKDLIKLGDRLYNNIYYESSKPVTLKDMLLMMFKRKQIENIVYMHCVMANDIFHTEESYLAKYCHEGELEN